MCIFEFKFCLGRRRQWHPTPVILPGKSHGQRSLVGCSPWCREESNTTERLHFHFSLSCIGEGNGNPLQCSCLGNPRDGVAWWAAIHWVAQSRTWLKRLSSSSRELLFDLQCHWYRITGFFLVYNDNFSIYFKVIFTFFFLLVQLLFDDLPALGAIIRWKVFMLSCVQLCDPMGCSLAGFYVHGIFQTETMEWVAISSSRGSSWP